MSWFYVPSATPGRVWLALLDRRRPHTVYLRGVREVTVDGRVTVARSRRPPRRPHAALRSGLVLQGRAPELWDPATGRVTQRLPGVSPVAARDWRLASWANRCRVLHVSDTRTGGRFVVRPGPGLRRFVESYEGAFSPDGRLLAVPAVDRRGAARVALVDLVRRTATALRGPHLAGDYQLLAWASSGWLFYHAGRGRLAAWRPGRAAAIRLALRAEPFVDLVAR